MRKISSVLSLILAVCLTIGGVSATWIYAAGPIADAIKNFTASMGEWDFGYTVTFINNEKDLLELAGEDPLTWETGTALDLTTNSKAQTAASTATTQMGEGYTFSHWINTGSTRVDSIPADNTENVTLYPAFSNVRQAIFVDLSGEILDWCFITLTIQNGTIRSYDASDATSMASTMGNMKDLDESGVANLDAANKDIYNRLHQVKDCIFDYWQVREVTDSGEVNYQLSELASKYAYGNLTIYPSYKFNGDVNLIPVDEDGDGITDSYQVGGYNATTGEQELVEIPDKVNGIPVTTINADAFSSYDDLHSIRIPATVEVINSQAFTADDPNQWGTQRDTVTIYYEGDPNDWATAMNQYNDDDYSGMLKEKWDNAMGNGSRVFFLVDGKVDNTKYWELNSSYVWVLHNHAYSYDAAKNCTLGANSHAEYGGGFLGIGASLQENKFTDYDGTCDCNSCNGATRPDAEYWTTE